MRVVNPEATADRVTELEAKVDALAEAIAYIMHSITRTIPGPLVGSQPQVISLADAFIQTKRAAGNPE